MPPYSVLAQKLQEPQPSVDSALLKHGFPSGTLQSIDGRFLSRYCRGILIWDRSMRNRSSGSNMAAKPTKNADSSRVSPIPSGHTIFGKSLTTNIYPVRNKTKGRRNSRTASRKVRPEGMNISTMSSFFNRIL